MSKLTELTSKLRVLYEKQLQTLEELDHALTLKEFYPDAFKHGKIRCFVVGAEAPFPRVRVGAKFVINHVDIDKQVEFKVLDVPVVILRKYLKDDIRWYLPRMKDKHERKFNDSAQPLCKYSKCRDLALEGMDHCDRHSDDRPLGAWFSDT